MTWKKQNIGNFNGPTHQKNQIPNRNPHQYLYWYKILDYWSWWIFIFANPWSCFFVWCPRIMCEPVTFVYRKCNARIWIISQVKNHPHHWCIVPLSFGRLYIIIWSDWFHKISKTGFIFEVCNPSFFLQRSMCLS